MTIQDDVATLQTNQAWVDDWLATANGDLTAKPASVPGDLSCAKSYNDTAIAAAQRIAAEIPVVTPPPALSIATASLPNAVQGSSYNTSLAGGGGTTGATKQWTQAGLPSGLLLSVAGVITGTPTVSGSFVVKITLSDTAQDAPVSKSFTMVVTPSAVTPPPTGKPLYGEYHAGDHFAETKPALAFMLDYAYNNATTYSSSVAQGYKNNGYRLMLKVGALNQQQAIAIAQELVAGGQADAWIPIMWEGNQGVNGWENPWNENAMTATQFITLFRNICAWMSSVPGANFTFVWCPNVAQQGNQKTGRTQFDTWPGNGVAGVYKIVIGPDGYDNPGDAGSQVAANMAFTEAYEQFAAQNGAVFAGLCECGDNGSDDPAYWVGPDGVLTHAEANHWQFVTNFQATTQEGGSFNSTTGPNSKAAIDAFYASA